MKVLIPALAFGGLVTIGALLEYAPRTASAQSSSSVWDGVYTEEQAKRGEALYSQYCGECHGPDLTGGDQVASLTGDVFMSNWNGLTLGDLLERIRVSMPLDNPDRANRQQKADIVAFLLSFNKFPAGSTELARQTEVLQQIRFESTKP